MNIIRTSAFTSVWLDDANSIAVLTTALVGDARHWIVDLYPGEVLHMRLQEG